MTHRKHLIADRFKGSGYKEALSIINTSAEYNLGPMLTAEEKIEEEEADKIADKTQNKMITFDMTVDAIYYILLRRKKMNYINMGLICKLFGG